MLVNEIFKSKKEHWQSWLEESIDTDLWMAHQYINSSPGDGRITSYTEQLLTGRKTRLRFDNYTSDCVSITNSIGQGDPLSMILYIIYNSDLVDIAREKDELALAFVDDTAFLAIGKIFDEMHRMLNDMLEWAGGGYQWSVDHNSRFEPSKFALIDFSLNRSKDRPLFTSRNTTITPAKAHKFLGILIDQEL